MPRKVAAKAAKKPAKKAPKAKRAVAEKPKADTRDIFTPPDSDFEPPKPGKKPHAERVTKRRSKPKATDAPPPPPPEPEPDLRWKDLLPEMSGAWISTSRGYHAGGPVKRSLCPGCRFFLPQERRGQGLCSAAVPESLRQQATYTHCMPAKPKRS